MSSFTNATGFQPIPYKNLWKVTEDFKWYFTEYPDESIVVPEGFIFNGADIPFPVTIFLPRVHPYYMQSAALHDYMLGDLRSEFTRKKIDEIFYESLLALGNSKIRSWCMFQAVRLFGLIVERENYYLLVRL
jgi:Protein of unknown function (DUF1353)